ncbi:MAG: LLM class flavin-dependent oxidoreductase [Actinobacteria bacterium]|nr:LLM class flavin-dependent oxidoreductase [Actinomycetota bacterium]
MRLSVMIEPQEGLSYAQILAVAQRAEQTGFAGFYRSDHYSSVADREGVASTDAWATLAGLARDTERITLGTMVTPVTFRPAGNLAKVVATVAEMAGTAGDRSRNHLGMGTGWLETEHRQHGFPFEDLATRFRRLDEHLQVVRGLWDATDDPFEFDGEFVTISGAHFAPPPDPRPRIIMGGTGKRKTPHLAARSADELNTVFQSARGCHEMRQAMDAACEEQDRDPASLPLTLMTGCLVGATDAEFRDRAKRLHARIGSGDLDAWLDELRGTWVIGGPEEAAEHLGRLSDVEVTGVLLQHQDPDDLDMLDAVTAEIAPRL